MIRSQGLTQAASVSSAFRDIIVKAGLVAGDDPVSRAGFCFELVFAAASQRITLGPNTASTSGMNDDAFIDELVRAARHYLLAE